MQIKSTLNQRAQRMCDFLEQLQDELCIHVKRLDNGARVFDFGVEAPGGLRAGLHLAEICLAGLAEVKLGHDATTPTVQVCTDHPIAACLASQYAGWKVSVDDYFAMGSGPMRAAAKTEPLFQQIDFAEQSPVAVGVLETNKLPTESVTARIAADCGIEPAQLSLCVAPTASIAGTVQVVARSIETSLHKMHELGFDLDQIQSGFGTAPLPPVAADDLVGIGRTNDAILYAGQVTIWTRGDDDHLAELVPRIPSKASADHGVPFADIFRRYGGDFYKIDPNLFSPAVVTLVNLNSGKSFSAGELRNDILESSYSS